MVLCIDGLMVGSTAAPLATLDVAGNLRTSQDAMINRWAIGSLGTANACLMFGGLAANCAALSQTSAGQTTLNAAAGQSVIFADGGVAGLQYSRSSLLGNLTVATGTGSGTADQTLTVRNSGLAANAPAQALVLLAAANGRLWLDTRGGPLTLAANGSAGLQVAPDGSLSALTAAFSNLAAASLQVGSSTLAPGAASLQVQTPCLAVNQPAPAPGYSADLLGNVRVAGGTLRVDGTGSSAPDLSLGYPGTFLIDSSGVAGGRLSVDNQGRANVGGPLNVAGPVTLAQQLNMAPGQVISLNGDLNHTLQFDATTDGPRLQGFAGGVLGTSQAAANAFVWTPSNASTFLPLNVVAPLTVLSNGSVVSPDPFVLLARRGGQPDAELAVASAVNLHSNVAAVGDLVLRTRNNGNLVFHSSNTGPGLFINSNNAVGVQTTSVNPAAALDVAGAVHLGMDNTGSSIRNVAGRNLYATLPTWRQLATFYATNNAGNGAQLLVTGPCGAWSGVRGEVRLSVTTTGGLAAVAGWHGAVASGVDLQVWTQGSVASVWLQVSATYAAYTLDISYGGQGYSTFLQPETTIGPAGTLAFSAAAQPSLVVGNSVQAANLTANSVSASFANVTGSLRGNLLSACTATVGALFATTANVNYFTGTPNFSTYQLWQQNTAPGFYLGNALAAAQSGFLTFNNASPPSGVNSLGIGVYGMPGGGITVSPTGNVGIGSSTPAYLMDVGGSARITGVANLSATNVSGQLTTGSLADTSPGSAAPVAHKVANVSFLLPTTQATVIQNSAGGLTSCYMNTDYNYPNQVGPSPGGRLQINDYNFGTEWRWQSKVPGAATNPLVERLTIANNGNVGVAQANPAFTLDVGGTGRIPVFVGTQANVASLGAGSLYAGNATVAALSTPGVVSVTNANPGDLIAKAYGGTADRYGLGQYNGGATRVFTSSTYGPATVNLSLASTDGPSGASALWTDLLTASQSSIVLNRPTFAAANLLVQNGNQLCLANNTTANFGYDVAGKEVNAGRMGYGVFSQGGALDIVGAGSTAGLRKVQMYDSLTVNSGTGNGIVFAATAQLTGNVNAANAAITNATIGTLTVGNLVGYSTQSNVNNISGNSANYSVVIAGNLVVQGVGGSISGATPVTFGYDVAGKDGAAGQIAYGRYSNNLDIVGAGSAINRRTVQLYDSLVVGSGPTAGNISAGNIALTGNVNAAGGAITGNLSVFGSQGISGNLAVYGSQGLLVQSGNATPVQLVSTGGGSGNPIGIGMSTFLYRPVPACQLAAIDDGNFSGHLVLSTAATGAGSNPALERLRVTSGGLVGVNNSVPQNTLDVNGNVRVAGPLTTTGTIINGAAVADGSIGQSAAIVNRVANVSFAFPSQPSQIYNSAGYTTNSWLNTDYNYPSQAGTVPGGRVMINDSYFSADWRWQTKAPGAATNPLVERVTMTGFGNVGINQTAPQFLLHAQPLATDVPAINPDATNTLMVYEDCRGATVSAGALTGSASYSQSNGYVSLTAAASGSQGQLNYALNPGTAWEVTAEVYVGTSSSSSYPADGWSFFCFNSGSAAIDIYQVTQASGYVLAFSEYANSNAARGATTPAFSVALYYNGTVLASQSYSGFSNPLNTWTQLRVSFVRNVWKVWLGSTQVINYADASRTLTGAGTSLMGFSAQTGASFSSHLVRNIQISKHAQGPWRPASGGNVAGIQYNGPVVINGNLAVYAAPATGVQLIGSSGVYYQAITNPSGSGNCGLQMQSYGGRSGGPTSAVVNLDDSAYSGHMCFHTASPGNPGTSLSERARLTSAGNFGINNPNPGYRLDVGGDINYSGNLLKSGVPSTQAFYWSLGSTTVPANNYVAYTVTFPVAFASVPIVTVTVSNSIRCAAAINQPTTTTVKVNLYNYTSTDASPYGLHVVATLPTNSTAVGS